MAQYHGAKTKEVRAENIIVYVSSFEEPFFLALRFFVLFCFFGCATWHVGS